jgi:hypothetical protein
MPLKSYGQKGLTIDTRKLTQVYLRVSTRIKRNSNSNCLNYKLTVAQF